MNDLQALYTLKSTYSRSFQSKDVGEDITEDIEQDGTKSKQTIDSNIVYIIML